MGKKRAAGGPEVSESEQLLFGGPLRYDMGWNRHRDAFLELNFRAMVTRLPSLLSSSFRLAWQADRRAARTVLVAEVGRGLAQAVGLLAVNSVLGRLIGGGALEERLRGAVPALVTMAAVMVVSTLLRAASIYATGRLEPKVERVATELYLERAAAVELAAIEDHAFHKLLDTAQYGAGAARRMISYSTRVVNAAISLIAAAGVLTVLHPALLPLLATMTLPSAWSALTNARRRYESFHTWVQHSRAGHLISGLLTEPAAAPEIRVHGVGPFLLRHYRAMSETAEAEQARLARLAARTGLIAAAWTGLATVATYATLGGLLLAGAMALSVAGTAVIAIRTGSSSLDSLVLEVNALHEEALFVGDLQRLYVEAAERAIPVGGAALPEDPREVRFENVSFSYPGESARPALDDVTLALPSAGSSPWSARTAPARPPWSSCWPGSTPRTPAASCGTTSTRPVPTGTNSPSASRWWPRTSSAGRSPPGSMWRSAVPPRLSPRNVWPRRSRRRGPGTWWPICRAAWTRCWHASSTAGTSCPGGSGSGSGSRGPPTGGAAS